MRKARLSRRQRGAGTIPKQSTNRSYAHGGNGLSDRQKRKKQKRQRRPETEKKNGFATSGWADFWRALSPLALCWRSFWGCRSPGLRRGRQRDGIGWKWAGLVTQGQCERCSQELARLSQHRMGRQPFSPAADCPNVQPVQGAKGAKRGMPSGALGPGGAKRAPVIFALYASFGAHSWRLRPLFCSLFSIFSLFPLFLQLFSLSFLTRRAFLAVLVAPSLLFSHLPSVAWLSSVHPSRLPLLALLCCPPDKCRQTEQNRPRAASPGRHVNGHSAGLSFLQSPSLPLLVSVF